MKLLSFTLSGNFAAFRDPTVTANQTVYFIPSKSAVIGLLGAILGVKRSHNLDKRYSDEYLKLFKMTDIGIQLCNNPKKITLFTNHVSLLESKTKPYKTELLESPEYLVYVHSSDEYMEKMTKVISEKNFMFSPYLGHAYCPARIDNLSTYSCNKVTDPLGLNTKCVIIDELDFKDNKSFLRVAETEGTDHKIIIERHLYHFFDNGTFNMRVIRHFIPIGGTEWSIKTPKYETRYSNFVELDGKIICLY